jgi:hypothetical protein
MIVGQQRARPDVGRQLVLGHADALALQVFGPVDAVLAHVDAGVAEGAAQEHRHRDVGGLVAAGLHQVAAEGQLADVELDAAKGAEEGLLGRQRHAHRVDAVDLHAAVQQRTRAVVVAHGDRESQLGHWRVWG